LHLSEECDQPASSVFVVMCKKVSNMPGSGRKSTAVRYAVCRSLQSLILFGLCKLTIGSVCVIHHMHRTDVQACDRLLQPCLLSIDNIWTTQSSCLQQSKRHWLLWVDPLRGACKEGLLFLHHTVRQCSCSAYCSK